MCRAAYIVTWPAFVAWSPDFACTSCFSISSSSVLVLSAMRSLSANWKKRTSTTSYRVKHTTKCKLSGQQIWIAYRGLEKIS
ncbi:hypothetical protein PC116_g1425 [Phytophthora cactorum]|nr:hypothetical protein PC116_g1425 [Phytophthora cactorum]